MACVTPASKKQKRKCHFDNKWINEFQGIGKSSKGTNKTNNEIDLLIAWNTANTGLINNNMMGTVCFLCSMQ